MKIVTKGLFGEKNKSINSIYKTRKVNEKSYNVIINKFTNNDLIKKLIYKFVNKNPYNINARVLTEQLALISNLTLDDQIIVLKLTLKYSWKSLVPAYEVLQRTKNIKASSTDKTLVDEIINENF